MSEWRSWHVHYTDLDRLVLECVHPVLQRVETALELRFWERHYAGGTHLRIRLKGRPGAVEAAGAEVEAATRAFVERFPSEDQRAYSPAVAAALLEREGEPVKEEELGYRNNVVLPRPYHVSPAAYASPEAAALAQDFRHDCMGLAVSIMGGTRPRREEMLRLYFLHALAVAGDLERGAVSFKSHWEGLAAASPPQVRERILASYRENLLAISALLREVRDAWENGRVKDDPVLEGWSGLLDRYRQRTQALLAEGKHVTRQPATLEEARALRERIGEAARSGSPFLRTLWSDERFLASVQFAPTFLVPRVLVNLLYVLLNTVGLRALDKMALCHHAHAAVEDHFGRSLDEILAANVARIVGANEHRWAEAPTVA